MKKRFTVKQAAFLLPLLLLLAVFAVYPIICSMVYSLFDYRKNDQTAAGLYTSTSFNAPLFVEDCDYINYYLEEDLALMQASEKQELEPVMEQMRDMMARFKDTTKITGLNAADQSEIEDFLGNAGQTIREAYAIYPDVAFYNGLEKIDTILSEMQGCVIKSNFTGLNAYRELLSDTRFFSSLKTTVVFTLISVACELLLGMALALIMNKAIRGIGLVRTTQLIPWAIPTAVAALMWCYMYDGGSGIVAKIFADIGLIESPELMLLSSGGAMTAAILADVWKTTPYMALLLLAGMQIIDRGLYESAKIDGAGKIRIFFSVTLPLLKPSILVALLFRTLDAFRVYDLIAVLTGGGNGTETLSIYAYKLMIGQNNYGMGSAVVLAMALCVGVIAFVFIKVLGAEIVSDN